MAKRRLTATLKAHRNRPRTFGVIVVVAIGLLGAFLITNSRAASPYTSSEAESGKTGGSASIVTDASASGGKAIQFGTVRPAGLVQAGNSKTNCIYTNDVSTNL